MNLVSCRAKTSKLSISCMRVDVMSIINKKAALMTWKSVCLMVGRVLNLPCELLRTPITHKNKLVKHPAALKRWDGLHVKVFF